MFRVKKGLLFFLICTAVFLAACQNAADSKGKNAEVGAVSNKQLKEQDMKREIVRIITGTEIAMHKLQEEKSDEWQDEEWVLENDKEHPECLLAKKEVQQRLSPYFTSKMLEKSSESYLFSYFCSCHAMGVVYERDFDVRFQARQINSKKFVASSIQFEVYEGPVTSPAGTNEYEFVKEDGEWKLANMKFTDVKKRPLHINTDEIYENFKNAGGVQIAGSIIDDGDKYYRVHIGDDYEIAINEKDTSLNYDLVD